MPISLIWGSTTAATDIVFSNISTNATSPTSATISWNVSPASQGQVEYGTASGEPYASTSTLETGYLSFHSQALTGLAANTTYYARLKAIASDATTEYTDEFTFVTPSSGVDAGYTFTDYTVPTGAGWTDGTDCRTALNNWIAANVPNGASTTSHSRVVFTAGFTWTVSGAISLLNKSHMTFYGQGTQQHTVDGNGQITATGNTGGGKITTTSAITSGDVGNYAIFSTLQGGTSYRATDIRFVGMQFEGNMSAAIDQTNSMADGGNEYQAGVRVYGCDGLAVYHCNFYRTKGDCVGLLGSSGSTLNDPGDVRTRNVTLQYNWFRSAGRVGVHLGKCQSVTIADNLFQDAAYAFIDFEPDYEHMRIGATTIDSNTFTGRCNWDTSFYMSSIFMTRPTSRPGTNWQIDGAVTVTDNVWNDLHNRNPGTYEMSATFGPLLKTQLLTWTGNKRLANSHTGPSLLLSSFQSGWTVTNNTGFGSTTFIQTGSGNSGSQTSSGNT